jgi:hypothetical protein
MHNLQSRVSSRVALLALGGALLGGCVVEVDEVPENVERHQEASGACPPGVPDCGCNLDIYSDCSVKMQRTADGKYYLAITHFICKDTAASSTPSGTCPVQSTDYVIGGGAFVIGSTGAALTKSRLVPGLGGGWSAKSAGVSGAVQHSLRIFSVGLQLFDANTLRYVNIANDIHNYVFASGAGDQVGKSFTVPGGEVLVGGGFSTTTGSFAVDAYASGMLGGTWHVNAKQFGGTPAKVTGEAISLSRCIPSANPSLCFSRRRIFEAVSPGGNFLQGVNAVNTDPALFVVGAGAVSSSWLRPLWGTFPMSNENGVAFAFTVAPTGDLGHVTAQALALGF